MTAFGGILLAALSVWDYPSLQPQHARLRAQFVQATREGSVEGMKAAAFGGTRLLPEDPTWRYNLACARARAGEKELALDDLETAIDLGWRDADAAAADADFAALKDEARFAALLAFARAQVGQPVLTGPLATEEAVALAGRSAEIGARNLVWNFDDGLYDVRLSLGGLVATNGNSGDLYFNLDGGHSVLSRKGFPGVTFVRLDQEGRRRKADLCYPTMRFRQPVFGNCSRAYVEGPFWRSLPRALMTSEVRRMFAMQKLYLANQTWVYPAVNDFSPLGTNGDVFASMAPYWIATVGKSYSDQYYLRAALEVSRSLRPEVKKEAVEKGLLAGVVQSVIRRSLRAVKTDEQYLTPAAHPSCFPPNGLDLGRLKRLAAAIEPGKIPPLATVSVAMKKVATEGDMPELTYMTAFAWAFVLRGGDRFRKFALMARGGDEYAFAVIHGDSGRVGLERSRPDTAVVTIDRESLSPTSRIDIGVFAARGGSGWGAPSFVSFSAVDPAAPYSDPVLTPRPKRKPAGTEGE